MFIRKWIAFHLTRLLVVLVIAFIIGVIGMTIESLVK